MSARVSVRVRLVRVQSRAACVSEASCVSACARERARECAREASCVSACARERTRECAREASCWDVRAFLSKL